MGILKITGWIKIGGDNMYWGNDEGLDRFRDTDSEDIIGKIEMYRYKKGFEWVNSMVAYLEDEEQVNEISKSIDEQIDVVGEDEEDYIVEEFTQKELEEEAKRAVKAEEEYKKEQKESREMFRRLFEGY